MTKTFTLTDWRGSITLFKTFTGTRPFKEVTNASWEDIIKEIKPDSPNALEDKTKALCFLPCELKEAPLTGTSLTLAQEEGEPTVGKMRSKQHVTPANLLVIDIDGMPKVNFDSALDKMNDDGITYIAYTTFSQGVKPDMRVRLVLPLDREISVEEYPAAWHGFDELYFDGQIGKLDSSGAKLCQAQATWSCHPDRIEQAVCWENKADVISAALLVTHANEKIESVKKVATKERTDYQSSDANMVADRCKQIGHFRDTRGKDQSEPYWFDSLGVVGHCEDGENFCHEWSSGHDDYNHFQTEKKIAHRLETPPTTCAQFRQSNPKGCEGCDQKCNSPITLGYQLDDEAVIKALAKLPLFDYDRIKKSKANELNVTVSSLDAEVKAARKNSGESAKSDTVEIEPYPDAISPAELFDEMKKVYLKHIVMDDNQAIAVTLWTVMTWFVNDAEVLPLLLINAPERSCGKTQLLDMVSRMSYRPMVASNITAAALFRCIDKFSPTLLIDEADTFIKKSEETQGLVNAGHSRTSSYVWRLTGDNYEPKQFSVWCPKAFAGIRLNKHFPDSTMSRGIVINIRRKLPHESVTRIRHTNKSIFDVLQSKLARFSIDYSELIRNARPELPIELNDRVQDNWELLFALSECAGDNWIHDTRVAALTLSESESSIGINTELLSDIREIFVSRKASKMSSTDLLRYLIEDDEAPWSSWGYGKPMSIRQLANLLDPYVIKSKNLKFNGQTLKGFELAQFQDAFNRYLEPEILPQLCNDTPEALIYKPSAVADDPQPNSAVAQRYDDLFEDIF